MPIRSKNIQALASAIDGPVVFNNIREIVRLGNREISRDTYDERYGAIYDAFVTRRLEPRTAGGTIEVPENALRSHVRRGRYALCGVPRLCDASRRDFPRSGGTRCTTVVVT